MTTALILLVISLRLDAAAPVWDWPTATPESQSMSSARLDVLKERLTAKKTRAFLVVRNDRVIYEWYAPAVTATTKQGTASLAKALAGGMSLAVAITDGNISIDDPAAKFVPQWKDDPRKSRITIRQLGSHLNLIMVRNGETLAPGPGEPPVRTNDVFTLYHDYRARILFEPLVEAVTHSTRGSRREEAHAEKPEARTPNSETDQSFLTAAGTNTVPRSSFIKEIRWAPVGTIRRAARGSDNWPLTWADDDALYGAYGDGNGFEPFDQEKLSLGLARIDGAPEKH